MPEKMTTPAAGYREGTLRPCGDYRPATAAAAVPGLVGTSARSAFSAAARLLRAPVSWPSAPVGLRMPVIPHSRLPSRLPGPWTASMRSWISFVRITRPSTLRLIGPRFSDRIEHELPAGSGGSGSGSGGSWLACADELPAAALFAAAAGRRTLDLLIFLLPALPLSVPTE